MYYDYVADDVRAYNLSLRVQRNLRGAARLDLHERIEKRALKLIEDERAMMFQGELISLIF